MSLKDTDTVRVQNLCNYGVFYSVPELFVARDFTPFETKELSVKEIRALYYTMGGKQLLEENLSVKNRELLEELHIDTEVPEYNWTKDDIKKCLLEEDIDVLLDALDFAPEGIVATLADMAIGLKIPDINKREAIKQATGKDVTAMIEFAKDENDAPVEEKKQRRVQPAAEEPKRRVAAAPREEEKDEESLFDLNK